jgi:hypothetical protein
VENKEEMVPEETEKPVENPKEHHQEEVIEGIAEPELENPEDREEMIDEDEISPQEASFMQGYEKDKEKTIKKKK